MLDSIFFTQLFVPHTAQSSFYRRAKSEIWLAFPTTQKRRQSEVWIFHREGGHYTRFSKSYGGRTLVEHRIHGRWAKVRVSNN